MAIYDEQVPEEKIKAYYDVLSPDFTDAQFDAAVNQAVKTSFKFPPIAAFYKNDNATDPRAAVFDEIMRGLR